MARPSPLQILSFVALAISTAGAVSNPVLGPGFVLAQEGQTCQTTCASQELTPAFFNNFYTDAPTLLCAANILGQGWIAGFQRTQSICTTSFQDSIINATQYACMCLTAVQTPGLEPSTGSDSCDITCAQTVQGQVGTAVRTDATSPTYACLASTEPGVGNRFGYANASTTGEPYTLGTVATSLSAAAGIAADSATPCVTAEVASTTTYSCFCTFEPVAPAVTSPTASSAPVTVSYATAGRKLLH